MPSGGTLLGGPRTSATVTVAPLPMPVAMPVPAAVPAPDSTRRPIGERGGNAPPPVGPRVPRDRPGAGDPLPQARLETINARLGTSSSPDKLARKAQLLHYEDGRAMFETWNAHLWKDADALLRWMSRPAWPGTAWPADDRAPDTGGGYYGARKGGEPLHIQADPADGQVLVANHTAAPVSGATASARLYDLGGRPLGAEVTKVLDVAAPGTADAFTVPFERALPAAHLLRLRLTDADGRLLSANDYVRCRTPTDLRSVNGLPTVRLSLTARPSGRRAVTATVRNTGTSPAAFVHLSLADRCADERALPALADDNYLWLQPGESREVTLSWAPGARAAGTRASYAPRVVAEAYNALRVTV
jgi:hypothetical protein